MPTIPKKRVGDLTLDNSNLQDNDLMLFAQPWAQGVNGYRTVLITFENFAIESTKQIVETTGGGVALGSNSFLIGTGSVLDPIRPNYELLNTLYHRSIMNSISYVKNSTGNYALTTGLQINHTSGFNLEISINLYYNLWNHKVPKTITPRTIDLNSFGLGSVANKTLYLVLRVTNEEGDFVIELFDTVQAETLRSTVLAVITTNGSTVTNLYKPQILRIGVNRLDSVYRVIDYQQLNVPTIY